MLVRSVARSLLLALFMPAAAMALGLGDIHLNSALDAPLDAQIDIVGASAEDLAGLKASLAPRAIFTRDGLDYPAFLGTVTLQPTHLIDGRNIIQVHSSEAATEPFATLLVQVDWARGHLVREYTVLLDPPVFTGANANPAVVAPSAGSTARSGAVQRTAGGATAAPSTVATRAPEREAAAAGGNYRVRRGDTLYSVAAATYGAGSLAARQRQQVAIYRANPHAFSGNMNELRAGESLALPSDADVAAISPADAATAVRQQNSAWRSGRNEATAAGGPGRLRLVPPQQTGEGATTSGGGATSGAAAGAGAAASGGAGTSALQQQVQSLQSQLADSKRLLEARNAQLASLQAQIVARAAAPAVPKSATESTPAAAPVAAAPVAAPAPATTPSPAMAPVAKPAAKPVATTGAPAGGATSEGLLGLLGHYWYVLAGVLAALIILAGVRATRSKREQEFDRSLDRLGSMTLDAPASSATRSTRTMPLRALGTAKQEQSFLVEESGSREAPDLGNLASTGEHVAIDDSVSSEAPVALDQGDPLAEADFHMAYGLYDQAADLVQIALSREPGRRDLKLKLLEVFFVWGNRDRFLQTARELASSRTQALPGEWEKTVIMGRQIAPDDELFTSAASLQGAASAGVDLNLEGGQNRVDFDLLGEPSVSATSEEQGVDLDLSAALGDGDPTGEALRLGDGVDFVLDDPERGNDLTGSTREMPGAPGSGTGTTGAQAAVDMPTIETPMPVEQAQLHDRDNSTIREKLDAPTRIGLMHGGDQTAELALDDLGLDLGAMADGTVEDTVLSGATDQATMLAGLDEHTRELMAQADIQRERDEAAKGENTSAGGMEALDVDATVEKPAVGGAAPSASGTWLFTDKDFADVVDSHGSEAARGSADSPTELVTMITPQPPQDSNATSRLSALSADHLDLDLGAFATDATGIVAKGASPMDLDVGAAVPPVHSSGETTLPDLEPATMSEVGTKLDLARAYMDMGDPEGARSILQEVLTEGSGSQKQEARRLIDALPG